MSHFRIKMPWRSPSVESWRLHQWSFCTSTRTLLTSTTSNWRHRRWDRSQMAVDAAVGYPWVTSASFSGGCHSFFCKLGLVEIWNVFFFQWFSDLIVRDFEQVEFVELDWLDHCEGWGICVKDDQYMWGQPHATHNSSLPERIRAKCQLTMKDLPRWVALLGKSFGQSWGCWSQGSSCEDR